MSFDVAEYARTARPLAWDDLDLTAFRDRPLAEPTLRCLRYMSDVETHTVCYLRDLLVTPSHADPAVTTFLTMWNMEEYWHGEVLDRVLDLHGVPTGAEHTRTLRRGLGWRDRWSPIRQSMLANLVGDDFVATHMTWGAINEWCTHSGYVQLAAVDPHPVLAEIVRRIARQETRHIAFYHSQARDRLARSARARRLTRFALRRYWSVVGSSVMPDAEVRHLLGHLYGGPRGLAEARKVDAKIHAMPGLAGLRLVEGQLRRYGVTGRRPGP